MKAALAAAAAVTPGALCERSRGAMLQSRGLPSPHQPRATGFANTILALLAASLLQAGAVVPSPAPAVREPPFPITLPASVRVERALEAAVRTHDSAMRELRAAVEACVAELQAQGMRPEAVLVTMRAFVRHAAVLHPPPGYKPLSWAADSLIDQIIHWSLLAYFRNEIQPDLPPADPSGREG